MRLERNYNMRARRTDSNVTKSKKAGRNHRSSSKVQQVINLLASENQMQLKKLMQEVERGIIIRFLDKTGGNQRHAAKLLGLKYTTLNEKVKRYQIRFQKRPVDLMVF